jgi:hypothetical protein
MGTMKMIRNDERTLFHRWGGNIPGTDELVQAPVFDSDVYE